jgi:hypothetical protein
VPAPTVDDINTSQREVYDTLTGALAGAQLRRQSNWVHVAVTAEAHVRATHAAAAGGQRIILNSGPLYYQDLRKPHHPLLPLVCDPDKCVTQNKLMWQWSSVSQMCHVENQA